MRIIYYSQTFFTDCDFPLIRELQQKGIDIRYFFPVYESNKRQALLDLKNLKKRKGIYKASEYPELAIYKDYINLNKVYLINIPSGGKEWKTKLLWFLVFVRMLMFCPRAFHFTWQLRGYERYLFHLPCKKVMTVHDPLSHSSRESEQEENDRLLSFRNADHFVLLSNVLLSSFIQKYNIKAYQVSVTKMGEFSHLNYIQLGTCEYKNPYILFFGQILSYKGIEYLCEAMLDVHKSFPDVELVIAGRGEIYFDFSSYENLKYIHLNNKYLTISDISTLLHHSLFSVCPYKEATQSGVVQTSFSCNTPMIVTNVGALPLSVQDGVTGLVVNPCDSKDLSLAIKRLLGRPHLLSAFKENIDKVWRPTVEWEPIADQYTEVWNQL